MRGGSEHRPVEMQGQVLGQGSAKIAAGLQGR